NDYVVRVYDHICLLKFRPSSDPNQGCPGGIRILARDSISADVRPSLTSINPVTRTIRPPWRRESSGRFSILGRFSP
ncbi:hypothetical protein, partial [Sinorhizobium meliloti]|uniref:hypothetical protein n=1 Tax=Rhizobium meliloti TaxID=382 RepID=UPI001AED0AAE